jgi:hypothetical protein
MKPTTENKASRSAYKLPDAYLVFFTAEDKLIRLHDPAHGAAFLSKDAAEEISSEYKTDGFEVSVVSVAQIFPGIVDRKKESETL